MKNDSKLSNNLSFSQDILLTSDDVAKYIGLSVKTLPVWRCTGRYNIPYVKVGRLVK